MPSNGCGMAGEISKAWKCVTGTLPPFQVCCDEHDLAYDQIETEEDRKWADVHFGRCMMARGYTIIGAVFYAAVRAFGWISVLKQKIGGK